MIHDSGTCRRKDRHEGRHPSRRRFAWRRGASRAAATKRLEGRSPHLHVRGVNSPGALGRGGSGGEEVQSRGTT